MKPKKNRQLEMGQFVEVYRNLNSGEDFSVRDKKSRLVLATGTDFMLHNATAKISEAGQKRVRRECRKNVHCVLVGWFRGHKEIDTTNLDELYYNPYELNGFINRRTNEPVENAKDVYFSKGRAWLIN